MRYETFEKDKYYKISNLGLNGENIFIDEEDVARLLFLITHLQSPTPVHNTSWSTKMYLRKARFTTTKAKLDPILGDRSISLLAFSVQKNGFSLLLKNLRDSIVSVYMHRVSTAYSKYFNSKYSKKGHVFNGPFKSELVLQTELLKTSCLIHQNTDKDTWSSKHDYLKSNRFDELLDTKTILGLAGDAQKYKEFLDKNTSLKEVSQKQTSRPEGL